VNKTVLGIADIFIDGKTREQPVTHIFQNFTACERIAADPGQAKYRFRISTTVSAGQSDSQTAKGKGKAAQIGQPIAEFIVSECRAAEGICEENTLAGRGFADIGVEAGLQRCGTRLMIFDHPRQRP